jgi:hypothetical protein
MSLGFEDSRAQDVASAATAGGSLVGVLALAQVVHWIEF